MRIVFEDDHLRRLVKDASYKPRRWDAEIIKSYRKKFHLLSEATDERDIYAIRSLHLEQLKGNRAGTCSIRINDQHRLIIRFSTVGQDRTVTIIEMVDYH